MADFGQLYQALREAQDRAGGVKAAASGFSSVYEARQKAFQQKVEAALKERQIAADEAGLSLKTVLAGEPRSVLNPETGKIETHKGIQGLEYTPGERSVTKPVDYGTGKIQNAPKAAGGGTGTINPKATLANIQAMKAILAKIPSGLVAGNWERLRGWASRGAVSTDAATYNDMKPAMAAAVYRAVTKDTRLSDQDAAARALPMIPDVSDARQKQAQKWAFIEKALNNEVNVSPDEFVAFVAQQRLGAPGGTAVTEPAPTQVSSPIAAPSAIDIYRKYGVPQQ